MAVDDSYSKLLLHCNGDDASTTFTDEAGKTVSPNGGAQLDTAYKKFGSASGMLYASGSYLTVPNSADFDFASGDFTLDFWIRIKSGHVYGGLISRRPSASSEGWCLGLNGSGCVDWRGKVGGSFAWPRFSGTTAINDEVWHHVALVRYGSSWKIYIDGVEDGSETNSGALDDEALALAIGAESSAGESATGEFWIDEVRVSKGIARWTANFTPQEYEYGEEPSAFAQQFRLKVLYGLEPRVVT